MSSHAGGGHDALERLLWERIRKRLPELEELLEKNGSHWHAVHRLSKFYGQSFKVYDLQGQTEAIVEALRDLLPRRVLNERFARIVEEGTGREFRLEHNDRWLEETRAIPEAFFHARMMLELAVFCGRGEEGNLEGTLDSATRWAALLCLYGLR